jgi:hypothetical protein
MPTNCHLFPINHFVMTQGSYGFSSKPMDCDRRGGHSSSSHRVPFPTEHRELVFFLHFHNVFLINAWCNSNHQSSQNAVKVHKNIIWIVSLKKGAWNVTCGNVLAFMSKYGTLNKNGIRGNCGSGGFLFYNVLAFFTTVSTAQCFDFPGPFL